MASSRIPAREKTSIGNYRLSGTLNLGRNTHLFGLTPGRSVIGSGASVGKRGRRPEAGDSFVLATMDDAEAAPALSLLRVQGRVDWKSGQGTIFLAPAPVAFSGHGGGKIYGMMAQGGPLVVKGIQQPLAFYALNVERKGTNPQSEITNCSHVRVYYFKVEAGTISRADAGDGNTPCRLSGSTDIRVYCMYGVVRKLGERPMLEVVDSREVAVSQLKTLSPGSYPHLIETSGSDRIAIPSSKIVGFFVREAGR